MEENIILVTCHTCECSREVAAENITIVQNVTHNTYTHAWLCMFCGTRQVNNLAPSWLPRMFAAGCKYQAFTMPVLSMPQVCGPRINNDDVNAFVEMLNSHDYLAAYAKEST